MRVEAAETGQRSARAGLLQYRAGVGGLLSGAHFRDPAVEVAGDLDQYLDEVGHRTARRADTGHEQDGVTRGLVDLDAKPVHQLLAFETRAVDSGRADVPARPNPPPMPRSEQHLLATWSPEGWRHRVRHAHHLRLLQVQEIPFALQAAGVAGQLTGASDDPVARNENG